MIVERCGKVGLGFPGRPSSIIEWTEPILSARGRWAGMTVRERLHAVERDVFRQLPPVGAVLEHELLVSSVHARGRVAVLGAVRAALEEARSALRTGTSAAVDPESLANRSREILENRRPSLRPVINATGTMLHTGLGRAPLAEEAIAAVTEVARGYCNLELDLEEGSRGHRTVGIARLICELTGAQAATAVNNNAAATVLALKALAAGREVIVSRGQLVEIGGSFRLPEIFEVSGAILREVGTTNKTRLSDYERAIRPETAAILRVHRSNFRIAGFTEDAGLDDLVRLAHEKNVWMIDDIGSGALGRGLPLDVADEPTAAAGIAAGADLVLFSGDKLLGGPQCGIMAGSARAVSRLESDPLMRALRLDKMTLAALEATLLLACDTDRAASRIPLWSMITTPLDVLRERATKLAAIFCSELGLNAAAVPADSFLGGGTAPLQPIPTVAVAVSPPFPSGRDSESEMARALRQGNPPVVTRVQKGIVLFDLRTVTEERDAVLLDAVRKVCHDRETPAGSNGPPLPA
jgi:L-seryl-tRNA(Ser) seleniumtransferase